MTNGEKFKSVFGFGVDGSRVIAVNSTWWDCDFQIRKPKTNADRIRSGTDEELAKVVYRGCPPPKDIIENCLYAGEDLFPEDCQDCWLDWLRQEAKDGE